MLSHSELDDPRRQSFANKVIVRRGKQRFEGVRVEMKEHCARAVIRMGLRDGGGFREVPSPNIAPTTAPTSSDATSSTHRGRTAILRLYARWCLSEY